MTPESARALALRVLADLAPEADLPALDPHAELRETLDLDSMDFLHFVIGLHQGTGLDIPESDYARLSTLAKVMEYLAARSSGG